MPPAGQVVKPDGLSPGAVVVWDRLAPICLAMRTLTIADEYAFMALCELQATLLQASARKDGEKGLLAEAVKLERETATSIKSYYEYFGLTPSSRSRLMVQKTVEQPESKWAGALK